MQLSRSGASFRHIPIVTNLVRELSAKLRGRLAEYVLVDLELPG